jgi:hypothetical protein
MVDRMPSTTLLLWVLTRALFLPHEPASLSLIGPGDLPAGTSVAGLIETGIPAITSDRFDASGMGLAVPARIGAYGQSWTDTTYRMGDLDVTNPLRPGTSIVLPDAAALSAVSITSAGAVDYVSTPGARMDLIPQRPADKRAFALEGIWAPPAWATTTTTPPAIAALHSLGDTTALFSGPISSRVSGVVGLHFGQATRVERNNPSTQTSSLFSITAHLVATLRPHEELRTLIVVQQAAHPIDGWLTLGDSSRARDRMGLAHVTWERSAPDRLALRVSGGYQRAFLDPAPATSLARIDSVYDGAVLPLLLSPSGTTSTFRAQVEVSRRPSSSSLHRWRLGATAEYDAMTPQFLTAPGAVETVAGQAARVWLFDTPATASNWGQRTAALYAADEMTLGRLRFDGGLRFEGLHATNGGPTTVGWTDVYPRAQVSLRVARDAGISVFAGASRSGGPLPPMALAFGDPASASGQVYRWTDANGDGVAQPSEYTTLVARVGPGAWSPGATAIDPALLRPQHTEEIFGMAVERERWTATVTGILRQHSGFMQVIDGGAAYDAIGVPDQGVNYPIAEPGILTAYNRRPSSFGLDQYLLTNPQGLTADFEGLDASLQVRSQHATLAFGATAAHATATTTGRGFRVNENDPSLLDAAGNPNGLVNAKGRPFFDRGYTGKIALVVNLPGDSRLGTLIRYQDGQPFSRLADVGGLNQGPEPIRAYAPGLTRFTFVSTVDLRFQKNFGTPARGAVVFVDVFDLFNAQREVEENVDTSPAFRSVSAVEPPRSARIGLRVRF